MPGIDERPVEIQDWFLLLNALMTHNFLTDERKRHPTYVCYSENHKADAIYPFMIWYILTLAENIIWNGRGTQEKWHATQLLNIAGAKYLEEVFSLITPTA